MSIICRKTRHGFCQGPKPPFILEVTPFPLVPQIPKVTGCSLFSPSPPTPLPTPLVGYSGQSPVHNLELSILRSSDAGRPSGSASPPVFSNT